MFNPATILVTLGLLVGIFVAGLGYGTHRANARHELLRLQSVEKARQTEQNLRDDMEVLNDVRDQEARRLAAERDAALRELRNRPNRMPEAAQAACAGTTGAQLSREDAEFLVGEASRSDSLRADLGACQQRERAVYEALTK